MDDNNKSTGARGQMAGSMQASTTPKKKHSLNRETQIKLGTQLQNMYNTYLNEGTPDRFRDLVHQLEAGKMPGFSGNPPYEDASDNKES